jgi:cytochrome c oxidase cbb3-type subunit 3
MSSLFRASCIALVALGPLLAACDREERHNRAKPFGETLPSGQVPDRVRSAAYERNAHHISQGQRLYSWMNCVGCHSFGGGGMGPPLMDDEWRYGGRIDQIAATIKQGRPNGMPSFEGKMTEDQIWQVAAFVRTLSGQTRKDAVGGRTDDISNRDPLSMTVKEPMRREDMTDQ